MGWANSCRASGAGFSHTTDHRGLPARISKSSKENNKSIYLRLSAHSRKSVMQGQDKNNAASMKKKAADKGRRRMQRSKHLLQRAAACLFHEEGASSAG